jgi:hypothetical protein
MQKLRAIDGSLHAERLEKFRRKTIAIKHKRFSVISDGLHARDTHAIETLHYLRELESENAMLRSDAINLALQILALCGN